MTATSFSMEYLNKERGAITPVTGDSPPSLLTITPTTLLPTDIWRKPGPPKVETFNAPGFYKSFPLRAFQSVRVTVSAPWSKLYDQGGLVFILPAAKGEDDENRQWIKSGIEFYEGEAYVSTVACDAWADWSLVQTGITPVPSASGSQGYEVTLEMERKAVDDTLWVYVIDGDKKVPVREVTWALSDEDGENMCWLGVYAATPMPKVGEPRDEGLKVSFRGLKYEFRE